MTAIAVTTAKVAGNITTKTRSYKAAEAITAGQAVYKLAAGTVGIADANASGKQQFRGIALETRGAGEAVLVAEEGPVEGFTFTQDVDVLIYLSDTAGGLDDGVGTMTVPVGRVNMRDDGTKFLWVSINRLAAWA
jgi:hypothetical protein